MRLRTLVGLVGAGVVAIGCTHTTAQQVEPKAPAGAATASATPTPVPSQAVPATSPAAGAANTSAVAGPPPASGPDTIAAPPLAASASTASADFGRDVRPILEQRCRPCHFEGGKMYERLPFDREETIRTLGTKLFTRIKAEDEQAVIRRFLAGS